MFKLFCSFYYSDIKAVQSHFKRFVIKLKFIVIFFKGKDLPAVGMLKKSGLFRSLKPVPLILTVESFRDDLIKKKSVKKMKIQQVFKDNTETVHSKPSGLESSDSAYSRQVSNMLKMSTCYITDSSMTTYSVGHRAWNNWCLAVNVDPTLSTTHHLYTPNMYGFRLQAFATFLGFLATDLRLAPPTIHVYKHAVIYAMKRQHLPVEFSDHELLDRLRGAIVIDWNANHEKSATRRLPFTLEMAIMGEKTLWPHHLPSGRIIIIAVKMGLCLLARASELLSSEKDHFIRSQDVIFEMKYRSSGKIFYVQSSEANKFSDFIKFQLIGVTTTIRSAKNDQAGEGHKTYWTVRELTETCVFDIVTDMFSWAIYARPPVDLPFLSYFGGRVENNFSLTYENLLKEIKNAARVCGFDPRNFGCHSLRIGGASILAAAQYPNHYIQKQGRWKSLAFLAYIHWSVKSMEKAISAIANPSHFTNKDLLHLNPGASYSGQFTSC